MQEKDKDKYKALLNKEKSRAYYKYSIAIIIFVYIYLQKLAPCTHLRTHCLLFFQKLTWKLIWHKFNHSKLFVSWAFSMSTILEATTYINFQNIYSRHLKIIYPFSPSFSIPLKLTIYLSLWIWIQQFQIFHINGIIQHLCFCIWLLLFHIMSSNFSYIIEGTWYTRICHPKNAPVCIRIILTLSQ